MAPSSDSFLIILTDAPSNDDITEAGKVVQTLFGTVFAVGTFRAKYEELVDVTGDPENSIMVPDYTDMNSVVFDELRKPICKNSGSSTYRLLDGGICEKNECAENNGGCAGRCVNTIGSYHCQCDGNLVLAADGFSCVEDFCRSSSLQCSHGCQNELSGAVCSCPDHMVLDEFEHRCEDRNECDVDNGGCHSVCVNLDPGYQFRVT